MLLQSRHLTVSRERTHCDTSRQRANAAVAFEQIANQQDRAGQRTSDQKEKKTEKTNLLGMKADCNGLDHRCFESVSSSLSSSSSSLSSGSTVMDTRPPLKLFIDPRMEVPAFDHMLGCLERPLREIVLSASATLRSMYTVRSIVRFRYLYQ